MTITTTIKLAQSPALPIVGQRVTLGASKVPAGRRIRWRLMSAPSTSALVLYTLRNLAYLDGGVLEPDVEGKYGLEAVEETFTSHIPHFAGDADASKNPVETWAEVASESADVYVGCKMQRVLGVAPDQVTLTMHCHDGSTTAGILTLLYDEALAPKLEDPTSDRARIAIGAPTVIESLGRIGGKGYAGTGNVISTDGLTEASALQSVFYSNSYAGLVEALKLAFYEHRNVLDVNRIHGVADDAETVTEANATDLATVYTLLNAIKTHYNAHCAKGAAPNNVHHNGADSAHVITAQNAATAATAIALANDIRAMYELHRIYQDPHAHYEPGDGMPSARITAQPCWDVASCILLANDEKAAFNAHITHTSITVSPQYHLLIDTNNESLSGIPAVIDSVTLITAANTLADMVHAHVSNLDWRDQSEGAYHYVVDVGSALDKIPRAANEREAIGLLGDTLRCYLRHVDTQGPWHGGSSQNTAGCVANPGNAWVRLHGVEKLNLDFATAARDSDLGSPANGLTSQRQLISIGGFGKA